MLTNTSYGSSRFKVSTAWQLSLSVSNTRVSTDLQKMDRWTLPKTFYFIVTECLVSYTKTEGLVTHHVIRTASCINQVTKNS
jgi:hypothetical protein